MTIRWWMPALCLAAWACAGRAQYGLADRLQDGPAILYTFGGDVEDASIGYGYQVAYRHDPRLSLEFSAFWQQDDSVEIGNRTPSVPPGASIDLTLWAFALTGRLGYAPVTNTYAYAGAGVGVYRMDIDNADLRETSGSNAGFVEADAGTDFGWHLVSGMEWNFHRHWQLFGEYRVVFYDTDLSVRFASTRSNPTISTDGDLPYDHMLLRVGVNYRF